jgi:AraC-like DNA-binding protein
MSTPSSPAPGRATFETSDPDEAAHHLGVAYGGTFRVLDLSEGPLRHERLTAGLLSVDDLHGPQRLGFAAGALGDVVVTHVTGGRARRVAGDDDQRLGVDDIIVVARPGEPHAGELHGVRSRSVALRPALFEQVTGRGERASPDRTRPLTDAAAAHWQRTVDFLVATLASPPAAEQPLVVRHAARAVAAAALAVFGTLPEDGPADRVDARSSTVRRAVAFIEENLDSDITPADIAEAALVSVRAVQLAFRRHLGTTPSAYLRRARLEAAHRDLLAADPALGDTVTAVASRWGFADASRFAARYRQEYGRSPRSTLHA